MLVKTLIFHVGMGKTGTTAIQQGLRANAAKLREAGLFCCDHWLLAATVGPAGFGGPDEFLTLLRDDPGSLTSRLAQIFRPDNPVFADYRTVVWSNESLAAQWNALGPVAAGFAANGGEAKIVLYLRHQVNWLISAYLQWCVKDKGTPGPVMPFARFRAESANALDYPTVVRNWTTCVAPASVIIRAYDPTVDSFADFITILGTDLVLKSGGERVYETPGYTTHAMFKLVNDQFDGPSSAGRLVHLMADAEWLVGDLHAVDPAPLDIASAELDAIEAEHAEGNAWLRDQCNLDLRREPPSPLVGRRQNSDKTNTDLIAALALMIVRLDARVAELERRLG